MHVTFSARGPAGAIAAFCADLGELMAKYGLLDDEPIAVAKPSPTIGKSHGTTPPSVATRVMIAPEAQPVAVPHAMAPSLLPPAMPEAKPPRKARSDRGKPRNGAAEAAPAAAPAAAPVADAAPAPALARPGTTAHWGSPPKVPAAPAPVAADDWGVKPSAPAAAAPEAAPIPVPEPVAGKGAPDDNAMSRFLQAAINAPGGFQIVAAQLNQAGISSVHSIPADRREGFVRAVLSALPEASRADVIAFAKGA